MTKILKGVEFMRHNQTTFHGRTLIHSICLCSKQCVFMGTGHKMTNTFWDHIGYNIISESKREVGIETRQSLGYMALTAGGRGTL